MRLLISGLIGLVVGLTGCQTPPPPVLEPLTLAELHRQDFSEGPRQCLRLDTGGWECGNESAYSFQTREIPYEIAPFMAQIYLHPAFTTEEDLIRQGAKDRPRWSIRHVCGGALIAPNWIATAAHCLPDPSLDTRYGVRIGLSKITEDFGELYRVEEVVRRDPSRATRDNDLALVRFSPDDAVVQSLMSSNIWNFVPEAGSVNDVLYDLSANVLVALKGSGMVEVLNRKTGERIQSAGLAENVLPVERRSLFKWDDKRIVETSVDGAETLKEIHFASLTSLAHIPDPDVLVGYSSQTGVVRGIDRRSGDTVFEVAASERGGNMTLLADQKRALVGLKRTGLIDIERGEEIPLNLSSDAVFQGVFENETRLLFQSPISGRAAIVDALTGKIVASEMLAPIRIAYGSNSPNYILTMANHRSDLAIYEAATLEPLAVIPMNPDQDRLLLQWSSDGQKLHLVRGFHGPLETIDPRELGRFGPTYFGDGWSVQSIKPTQNPDIEIVTLTAEVFENGEPSATLFEYYAIRSDGTLVRLKSVANQDAFGAASGDVQWEALPDARVVQTNFTEGRTYIWNLADCPAESGACLPMAQLDHSVPLFGVDFTEDMRMAIAFAHNGTVQLWSLETHEELARVFHGGTSKGARYDPTRNELLTFGGNGFVRIWDVASEQEVQRFDFADFTPVASSETGVVAIEDPDPVEASPQIFTSYLKIDESGENVRDGEAVRIFGWGRYGSDVDQNRSPELREGGLQILTSETCRAPEYWDDHKDLHDRVFCAHDLERKTCVGDSGGPVVQGQRLEDLTLVGISSWGSSRCSADGKPGVYTRIASHADWIKRVIGADLPESVASPDPVSP